MSDVFFIPFDPAAGTAGLSQAAVHLLRTLLERSGDALLPADVPLKVHFGEKGNRTYLKPEVYDGIIDYIQSQGRACHFVETSVLYGGERFSREKHLALAKKHALPFLVLCLVYTWGAQASEKSKRKNPAVYTNDKRPTHLDKDSWSVKEPSLGRGVYIAVS